ncbi:fimbrial biogenesis chaperone [Enterobacter cloacae]|uniref:fimbrial biogenesis chaperone n=1 Tax=Enterobacter cloacae TaxID=550 RepID=UPI002B2066CB|nr:molecular chaperone [Enterobacter cloacae]MEA5217554.1 molecular chaperone [Enterobacter cloacae]
MLRIFCLRQYQLMILLFPMFIISSPSYGDAGNNPDGIKLQSTRVIYPAESHNGITFTITNNTAKPYLLQSRIIPWQADGLDNVFGNKSGKVPFIVLPPLQRLEASDALTLRIRLMRNTLPKDRESVFILSLKTIPGKEKNTDSATLTLAMQNNLKLFYRPEGLPEYDVSEFSRKIRFISQREGLKVINPTPYYLTFRSLFVGEYPVEKNALSKMIPPFGEQMYPLSSSTRGRVTWSLIDGEGRNTPEQGSALSD